MTFIESTFLCEFYEIEALQVELKPKSCDRVTIVLPYWHVLGIAFRNFMSNTLDLPFSFGFKMLIVCPPVVILLILIYVIKYVRINGPGLSGYAHFMLYSTTVKHRKIYLW